MFNELNANDAKKIAEKRDIHRDNNKKPYKSINSNNEEKKRCQYLMKYFGEQRVVEQIW